MKIEISDYENFLCDKYPDKEHFIIELLAAINSHIQCKECLNILPLENFSDSKSFSNRNGKYVYCKNCTKKMYKQGRL